MGYSALLQHGNRSRNHGKETEMSNLKCPFCNNTLQIGITYYNGGMDGSYKNWIVSCPSCNMFQIEYAADKFYSRESYTKEQVMQNVSAWLKKEYKEGQE